MKKPLKKPLKKPQTPFQPTGQPRKGVFNKLYIPPSKDTTNQIDTALRAMHWSFVGYKARIVGTMPIRKLFIARLSRAQGPRLSRLIQAEVGQRIKLTRR
jgi:hypothetical protein